MSRATSQAATLIPLGTCAQDREHVTGPGDLDECEGRVGVTPAFPSGIHYSYSTDSYPYFQCCIEGKR